MKLLTHLLTIVSMLHTSLGFAQENATDEVQTKLIGVWQEGLTEKVRNTQNQKIKNIFLGQVMTFEADNTFQMFPKCGRETAEFKAKGMISIKGKWRFDNSGALHVIFEHQEKRLDKILPIKFDADNLIVDGLVSSKTAIFGRYFGALPPQCPSN